jgi:ubiquinol-cytochrome c reductase iron-sulfur subunit
VSGPDQPLGAGGPEQDPQTPDSPEPTGAPGTDPVGGQRPVEPAGAPHPTEPTSPIDQTTHRSVPWMLGWALVGLTGAAIGVWALIDGRSAEVQALALTLPFLATAIVFHHLIVTHDAGELAYEREERISDELAEDRVVETLGRRPLLARSAVGVLAAGAVATLGGLRVLGPRRRRDSAWGPGVPAVTSDGDRLRPEDVPEGGVVTVWPEDAIDVEAAAVMVIRLRDEPLEPTDLGGIVEGRLVGYSRICTHAGCPVALYRDVDQALFCPCHQATFDARRAATPTFGPASGPLPQLPLGVDDEGYLVALDDFPVPPGPLGGEV